MNRRGFFKFSAGSVAAIGFGAPSPSAAPLLPVAPAVKPARKYVIRTGVPTAVWKKLYQGVEPKHRAIMRALSEPNEILDELTFKED